MLPGFPTSVLGQEQPRYYKQHKSHLSSATLHCYTATCAYFPTNPSRVTPFPVLKPQKETKPGEFIHIRKHDAGAR